MSVLPFTWAAQVAIVLFVSLIFVAGMVALFHPHRKRRSDAFRVLKLFVRGYRR